MTGGGGGGGGGGVEAYRGRKVVQLNLSRNLGTYLPSYHHSNFCSSRAGSTQHRERS